MPKGQSAGTELRNWKYVDTGRNRPKVKVDTLPPPPPPPRAMPTSSQARILLSHQDLSALPSWNPVGPNHHHPRPNTQRKHSVPYLSRTPSHHHPSSITAALSLPRLDLMRHPRSSCGAEVLEDDPESPMGSEPSEETFLDGPQEKLLPPLLLENRLPHLICYPSTSQNGSFGSSLSQPHSASFLKAPSALCCGGQSEQGGGCVDQSNNYPTPADSDNVATCSKDDAGKLTVDPRSRGGDTTPDKEQASVSRKRRKSSAVKARGNADYGGRRKSSAFRAGRFKMQGKRDPPEDQALSQSSDFPEQSSQLEVDLLACVLPGEGVGPESSPQATVSDTKLPEAPNTPSKRATIKSMYRQLLSLGMSANAFRSVTVETEEGHRRNADSEQEASEALDTLASSMVRGNSALEEEEEEEEEEAEDVELIMGSIFADLADEGHVNVRKPSAVKKSTVRRTSKPAPPSPTSPSRPVSVSAKGVEPATTLRTAPTPPTPSMATAGMVLPPGLLPAVTQQAEPPARTRPEMSPEDKALLQSVATGAAYGGKPGEAKAVKPVEKVLKKKVYKLPPMRLRVVPPPQDPLQLCFRTPNVDLSHDQVKNMLEAQLGDIVTLQHIPEYLQMGSVQLAPRAMWIFKMENTDVANYCKICSEGVVGYDGENLRVRKRDDVYNEEHHAYLLVKQIKEEQYKRMKNRAKERKPKAPSGNAPAAASGAGQAKGSKPTAV